MADFITNIASIMSSEITSLDTIANNTANTNTAGYKSQFSFISNIAVQNALPLGSQEAEVALQSGVNMTPGSIDITNNKLDFASVGEGWFVVSDGKELLLTRNGRFSTDSTGRLITEYGWAVQGEGGDIYLESDEVFISNSSIVEARSGEEHKLLLAMPGDNASIKPRGNSSYQAGELNYVSGTQNIVQGALEASNVDTTGDVIRMMETTRHIETLQRALSTYNDMLDIGINEIGK